MYATLQNVDKVLSSKNLIMTQMTVEIDKRGASWAPLLTIHSTARVESLA